LRENDEIPLFYLTQFTLRETEVYDDIEPVDGVGEASVDVFVKWRDTPHTFTSIPFPSSALQHVCLEYLLILTRPSIRSRVNAYYLGRIAHFKLLRSLTISAISKPVWDPRLSKPSITPFLSPSDNS